MATSTLTRERGLDRWLTPNQQRVLSYLESANKAVGAYELVGALGVRAATTVYRALDELSHFGLVHRIQSRNCYVACGQRCGKHHSALMICVDCDAVREVRLDTTVAQLRLMASQDHFSIDNITIEVVGQCIGCHDRGADRHLQVDHL